MTFSDWSLLVCSSKKKEFFYEYQAFLWNIPMSILVFRLSWRGYQIQKKSFSHDKKTKSLARSVAIKERYACFLLTCDNKSCSYSSWGCAGLKYCWRQIIFSVILCTRDWKVCSTLIVRLICWWFSIKLWKMIPAKMTEI